MKKATGFVFLFLSSLLNAQQSKPELIAEYMQAQENINNFSGVVLVAKGNKVLLQKSFGIANRASATANTPDTKFRIYSITKQFTATCILKLAEEGKLNLQDNLSKFFPEFPNGDHITIHMLLTHTSGLKRDFLEPSEGPYKYLDYIGREIRHDELLTLIEKRHPDTKPGKKLSYSNLGFSLLGLIVEKASGMSYSDYLSRTIFIPLHMTNSGVCEKKQTYPNMAIGYNPVDPEHLNPSTMNMDFLFGCGNIYSTVEDLNKWDKSFYTNTILQEQSKKKMYGPYMEGTGYGVHVDSLFHQSCSALNGSAFGFNASLSSFPKDSVCIIVLSNNESPAGRINYSLAGIIFDIAVTKPYRHTPVPLDAKSWKKYAGDYGAVKIKKRKGHLYLNNAEQSVLCAESSTRFYLTDKMDWTIEFMLDKDGHVSSLISSIGGISETHTKIN